ncbi:MAG: GNAT family N-acetyltransferase [Solirubrobacterales bacterium]
MSVLSIRAADAGDAAAMAAIFREGIEDRMATFETAPAAEAEMAVLAESDAPVLVAERAGYHKLVGKVFTANRASIELVRRCGWRELGVHLRHGRLDGEWRDVLVVERLLGDAAV